jgi:predicted nucleotidyltransferase
VSGCGQVDLESLRAIREVLGEFPEVRLAILFGSRARGTATPSSDLDLAVEAPPELLGALGAALSSRLGLEVDITSAPQASIPLLEALIADGDPVFEARPGAYALWRSRTLAQLETDRPWYHRQRDAWIARVAEQGFERG